VLRARLGDEGRRRFEDEFSLEAYARKIGGFFGFVQ
jgi:hypothetical protein